MSTILPRNTINYLIVTNTNVRGRAKKNKTPATFIGSVQSVTGKDIETVPTGKEDRGRIKAYSDTKLNVPIAGTNKSGDIILFDNKEWKCMTEEIYQNGLIPHYKYIAQFLRKVKTS